MPSKCKNPSKCIRRCAKCGKPMFACRCPNRRERGNQLPVPDVVSVFQLQISGAIVYGPCPLSSSRCYYCDREACVCRVGCLVS